MSPTALVWFGRIFEICFRYRCKPTDYYVIDSSWNLFPPSTFCGHTFWTKTAVVYLIWLMNRDRYDSCLRKYVGVSFQSYNVSQIASGFILYGLTWGSTRIWEDVPPQKQSGLIEHPCTSSASQIRGRLRCNQLQRVYWTHWRNTPVSRCTLECRFY